MKNIFLLIVMLMSTGCLAQTSIFTADANGVTRLHAVLNDPPTEEIVIPPVNPPGTIYIGIPEPRWWTDANAFDVSYRIYDTNSNQVAARAITPALVYRDSDANGYYTHYIDACDVASTDTANLYGTIAKPRKTVPSILPAGSIVEIHNFGNWYYVAGSRQVTCQGTAELPIFIRGVAIPTMATGVITKGAYVIIEGFYIYNGGVRISIKDGSNAHHVIVRNNEFKGDGIAKGNAAVVGVGGAVGNIFHNVVIYNNEMSYFGKWDNFEENDFHGVNTGAYVQNVWVINNHIHHLGGDSVQCSHDDNFTTNYIYIAGNTFHDNYEDGVDLKEADDIIVSQNTIYNMAIGGGVVTHYDPHRIYVLFNHVYDCQNGITCTGASGYVVAGNIVHNIHGPAYGDSPPTVYRHGRAITWYSTGSTYAIGNIVYDSDVGIASLNNSATNVDVFVNNIIADVNSTDGYSMFGMGTGAVNSTYEYNVFGPYLKIYYGSTNYNTVLAWQNATVKGDYCVEADPLFENPANGDFTINAESPILDMGLSSHIDTVSETFYTLYGVRIANEIKDMFTDGIIYAPNAE